jgi:hypothetical protein
MINLNSILATFPEWGQKVPPLSLFGGENATIYHMIHYFLSFHEKLSDTEIEEIIRKMDRMFSEEGYEKTYEWALAKFC